MITIQECDVMKFPAGESFVKMKDMSGGLTVDWRYESDEELFQLALANNIRNKCAIYIKLPYFPHARQDRQTSENYPFSLDVFCKMLACAIGDSTHYIDVIDPHSGVLLELAKKYNLNIVVTPQWSFAKNISKKYDYIVSPDKGAIEKTARFANELSTPMFCCSKNRDPVTGKLSSPTVPDIDLKNKKLLVTDDICDGGGTFLQLAEKFPDSEVDLFVTHAIFSKGVDALLKSYKHIYTTNSLNHYKKYINDNLSVFEI